MDIFPSLISSDLLQLGTTIKTFDDYCDGYHIDVMDNHFVPNLTWGPAFVNAIAKATKLPLNVHLMVTDPRSIFERLKLRPDDYCVFHAEALSSYDETKWLLEHIQEKGVGAGLAFSPKTQTKNLEPLATFLDYILIMSVEPGFSGQKFLPEVLVKIEEVIKLKRKFNYTFKVAVDGGITKNNIGMLAKLGVQECGIAGSIFFQEDPLAALKSLYAATRSE